MADDFRSVFSKLLRQIAKREYSLMGIQIVLAVVIPVGIALAVNWLTGDSQGVKIASTVFLIILIFIQIVLLITTLLGPSTPARAIVALDDVNNKYEQLQEKYAELGDQRNAYFSSVWCVNQALEVVRGILDSGDVRVDESLLEDHLKRILAPYVKEKDRVFNFGETTASYRITVLLYDPTVNKLAQRYSYADPGIMKRDRSWGPKDGHAGMAFTMKKVIITPDLSKVGEYREHYDEIDARQYRSTASTPLFNEDGACGVVIVTGSQPDQFDYDNSVEIFETIGHILNLYLRYTKIKIN